MKIKDVEYLYGLKVQDKVKYIGDISRHGKEFLNKLGEVIEIDFRTGQFTVKFENVKFLVSCERHDLLLLENEQKEVKKYQGHPMLNDIMCIEEMRYYLINYNSLKEGRDFAITDRVINNNSIKEVYLNHQSYVELMSNLFDSINTFEALTKTEMKSFDTSFSTNIQYGKSISVSFKVSVWNIVSHVLEWQVQKYLCKSFGLDLYKEMGFNNYDR